MDKKDRQDRYHNDRFSTKPALFASLHYAGNHIAKDQNVGESFH